MLHGETMWELLEQRVDATPDALMFVDEDMSIVTFADFWDDAEMAAAGLLSAGIKPGDVVSWQLPNWIQSAVLSAALSRIGAIQNPILPAYRRADVKAMVSASESSLLVVPRAWKGFDYERMALDVAKEVSGLRVLVLDGALPQGDDELLPPLTDLAPSDTAESVMHRWIFFSPGRGTSLKGVLHDDLSLGIAAQGLVRRLALISRDRNALVAPVGDLTGILWLFASIQSGCANVLASSSGGADAIETLSRENVTVVGWDSSVHETYLKEQRASLGQIFGDVRVFTGFGLGRSKQSFDEISALFDAPLLCGYGCAEVPLFAMADISDSEETMARSFGRPQNGVEVRVTDAMGAVVGSDIEGELRIRAPQTMVGYLDPADALGVFDDDGFFLTGDLARLDPDGNVIITGRLEDRLMGESTDSSRFR